MTQEDKKLLIRDLSGRLPYGVKIFANNNINTLEGIHIPDGVVEFNGCLSCNVEEVKPYLFPIPGDEMSSKKLEYNFIVNWIYPNNKNLPEGAVVHTNKMSSLLHFYNVYHLDYNGLIPMGLALDATGLNIY